MLAFLRKAVRFRKSRLDREIRELVGKEKGNRDATN